VLHGNRTYLLQDEDGQIIETHSISAGLDYPVSGRSTHGSKTAGARVRRHRQGGVAYVHVVPLRRHHAGAESNTLAHAMKMAPDMGRDKVLLVNLSGRGDKDMHTVAKFSGITL
jgi:tryptophan synthase beta chain